MVINLEPTFRWRPKLAQLCLVTRGNIFIYEKKENGSGVICNFQKFGKGLKIWKRAKNTLFVTLWPSQHWLSPITSKKDTEVEHYVTSAYPSLLLFPRVPNILKMVQIHLWLPCSRDPGFALSHLTTDGFIFCR